MNERDWMKIRKNFVYLTKNLNLDDVIPYMYQDWVVTDREMERLSVFKNPVRRVSTFLDIIHKKGNAYPVFCHALQETQPDLLKMLQDGEDPVVETEGKQEDTLKKDSDVKEIKEFSKSVRIQAQVPILYRDNTLFEDEFSRSSGEYYDRFERKPKVENIASPGHEHCDRCCKLMCVVEVDEQCQVVSCPDGCKVKLHKCKIQDHQSVCMYAKVPCVFSHIGCEVVLPRLEINSHIQICKLNERYCSSRAQYKECENGCGFMMDSIYQDDHNTICKNYLVPCINASFGCPYKLQRKNMRNHITFCPARIIECNGIQYVADSFVGNSVRLCEYKYYMDMLLHIVDGQIHSRHKCPGNSSGCSFTYITLSPKEPSGEIRLDNLFSCFSLVPSEPNEGQQAVTPRSGGALGKFELNKQAAFNTAQQSKHRTVERSVYKTEVAFQMLPIEILQHIIRYLDSLSINNLSLTCRTLREACMTLLSEKGMVNLVWIKTGINWNIAKMKWTYSNCTTPIHEWKYFGSSKLSEHMKMCPILKDNAFNKRASIFKMI